MRKRVRSGALPARGERGATEVLVQVENHSDSGPDLDYHGLGIVGGLEVARLAGEIAELRARLADAQDDRDRWHLAALNAREETRAAHAARDAAERELRMALARM